MAQAQIELFYWPTPNGWKISIMLEELGVPYTVRYVDIGKGDQFKEDFLRIAPNNRIPAIVDPDGPGGRPISVFESGAILIYLGRKYSRFYPAEERARTAVDEWLFWQVGGLGPMAGQANHFLNYAAEKIPYAVARYVNEVRRLCGVMERRLEGRDYLADDYSIADIACFAWAASIRRHDPSLGGLARLNAWFDRIDARLAVKRGLAVGAEVGAKTRTPEEEAEARRWLFGQIGAARTK
jgi:GST-like protein